MVAVLLVCQRHSRVRAKSAVAAAAKSLHAVEQMAAAAVVAGQEKEPSEPKSAEQGEQMGGASASNSCVSDKHVVSARHTLPALPSEIWHHVLHFVLRSHIPTP